MIHRQRQQGASLLLALAVLAVLSILSLGFIRISAQEREGAANYTHEVRARMLADAGVHIAIGELATSVPLRPYTDLATDRWIFRTDDGTQPGTWPAVQLETARFPSLALDVNGNGTYENGVAAPSSADLVNGRAVSGTISHVMPAARSSLGIPAATGSVNYGDTFESYGNVYTLRIRDTSSKLNVNSAQTNMADLLTSLGRAITDVAFYDPVADARHGGQVGAAAILAYRSSLGGQRFNELEGLAPVFAHLSASGAQRALDTLAPFMTTVGWVDPSTVRPDPSADATYLPTPVLEARSPVNINTAPRPVLVALLDGIHGYTRGLVANGQNQQGHPVVVQSTQLSTPITFTQAGLIADQIMSARATNAFRSWDQFKLFVLSLPSTHPGLASLRPEQLDAIRANFNPNSLINRFNPNREVKHGVDKLDLVRYSTEFCFGSNGWFEIECLGRVTALNGAIMARSRRYAVVKVHDIVRHTSQRDFITNRVGSGNTLSYPESMADLASNGNPADDTGSEWDGQISMFKAPVRGSASFMSSFIDTFDGDVGPLTSVAWDGGAKTEDTSVFAGSDLMPDGMLSQRSRPHELDYAATGNMRLDEGTIEFWVKLQGDAGSDESLMYTIQINPAAARREGISNKLIRYGNQLINTRFYWGHPGGARGPYPLTLSEATHDISHWRAGEWHHIAISYFQGIGQRFYADGVLSTNVFTRSNPFRLGSNEPLDNISIGGYRFYSPYRQTLYRGTTIQQGINERFSNSTITGWKYYTSPDVYQGFNAPIAPKFEAHPVNPSVWHGRFHFTLPGAVRIGSLAWTQYLPQSWGNTLLNQNPNSPDTQVMVQYRIDAGPWITVPSTPAQGGDGRGAAVDATLPASTGSGRDVEYRIYFLNPGGVSPLNATPVLDDITLTYAATPEILVWR